MDWTIHVTFEQIALASVLAALLGLFLWGRLRHDVVALGGLLAVVLLGIVPAADAFSGFGNPAVVTVALVLVISKALSDTGAVELLARPVRRFTATPSLHVAGLAGSVAFLSAFMNNVGALAMLMPVAMQTAARTDRSPAILLMPLAFASILGGMATLIGTPPNLLVSSIRADRLGEPFGMLDFAPVGVPLAVAGVAFVALAGWRLVPRDCRKAASAEDFFDIADYLVEFKVGPESRLIGRTLGAAATKIAEEEAVFLSLVRENRRYPVPPRHLELAAGDVLLVEAAPEVIDRLTESYDLHPAQVRDKDPEAVASDDMDQEEGQEAPSGDRARSVSEDARVIEAIVRPGGPLEGRTVGSLRLAENYRVAVLGLARESGRTLSRLSRIVLRGGDVLLLRGHVEQLAEVMRRFACLPLAERGVQVGRTAHALPTLGIFAAGIALSAAGILATPVALGLVVLGLVILNIVHARELYEGIDWSIIVLLGALIPLGGAIETTGVAEQVGHLIGSLASGMPAWMLLAVVLVLTMLLSDVLNNAATVVIMAPIAINVADQLGVRPDAFLMAVAIGGSSAFLTPIGHQNNILVMAPGGYRFGDYWRMGLPLEAILVGIAVPLLLVVWPL